MSLGKFGSFPTNALLGRPYYCTYEISEQDVPGQSYLRIVPAAELHVETLAEDSETASELQDEEVSEAAEDISTILRNNQLTIDDPSKQALSTTEIENLKSSNSSRQLIEKLMSSHSALTEKTAYSLAKYMVRKQKKYLKRFVVLPVDTSFLAKWYLHEKDAPKTLELREETLGLIASWSNVQCGESEVPDGVTGRWLVIDDTAGLVVAALAERMGILHPLEYPDSTSPPDSCDQVKHESTGLGNGVSCPMNPHHLQSENTSLTQNSITVIHSATQPNLSMLSYFSYDPGSPHQNTTTATASHPLYSQLKTLTWLQLHSPNDDVANIEPQRLSEEELALLKSGKRGSYYRKRRRWERLRATIDETRSGNFDGLIVASVMNPSDVLHHLLPLLRGGAPVVVYGPNLAPLVETADAYSSGRRTAFINAMNAGEEPETPSEDFSVDPRLLLAPTLRTAQAHEWQVLPGRTHPLMTSRGGAEGCLLTATRVLPTDETVHAHGNFMKRKKPEQSVDSEKINASVQDNNHF